MAASTAPVQPIRCRWQNTCESSASSAWSPDKLEEGCWSSSDLGDTGKLPEHLVGGSIQITTRGQESWTATVVEVVQRRADFALLRDSGQPNRMTDRGELSPQTPQWRPQRVRLTLPDSFSRAPVCRVP